MAIRDEREAGRAGSPSGGGLDTTLDRMGAKGVVESFAGEVTQERGGRPRRYVRLTSDGRALLARSKQTLMALWDGLEGALDR